MNAGLLPSATHERVRNIVASPLSGRVGGRGDVRGWTTELDTAIQAEPELAALPGRFWFGIDDGRGDVSGLGADVGAHLLEDSVALLLAGHDTGVRLDTETAVPTMVSVAKRFAVIREKAWRIAELADSTALLENLPVSAVPGGPRHRSPAHPSAGSGSTTVESRSVRRSRWACCRRASRNTSRRLARRW